MAAHITVRHPNMLAAYNYAAASRNARAVDLLNSFDSNWAGCKATETRALATVGDAKLAADCAKEIERLADAMPHTARQTFAPAICGGYVNVGDALAGEPFAFRARTNERDACAPLRIVASIVHTCAASTEQILARGAAVAAVAMAAMQRRPVEIVASTIVQPRTGPNSGKVVASLVTIDPRSIDLAGIAFALAHPAAFRRIEASGVSELANVGSGESHPLVTQAQAVDVLEHELGDMRNTIYLHSMSHKNLTSEGVSYWRTWAREQITKLNDEA